MEVKDNRNIVASKIKKLTASKALPAKYYSDASIRVSRKNKAVTGVLPSCNHQVKKTPNYSGAQCYCILCKKAGIPDCKWKLHRSKNCFGERSDQASVEDSLGGSLGNITATGRQYHRSENKCKMELKYLKKRNKTVFSIAKCSDIWYELKKINKIYAKS